MCLLFSLWNLATPLIAMLFVSVAPDVNIMSLVSAPIRSATCCVLWYQNSTSLYCNCLEYFSSMLHRLLCLPSICMCTTMRVAVLVGEEWQHSIKHTRVDRGCGLTPKDGTRDNSSRCDSRTCMSRYIGRVFSFNDTSWRGNSNLKPNISREWY